MTPTGRSSTPPTAPNSRTCPDDNPGSRFPPAWQARITTTRWLRTADPAAKQHFGPSKNGVTKPLLVLLAVLACALIGTTTMWVTTESKLSAMQSAQVAQQTAAADVPDLRAVADKYFKGVASVSGDADSLSITIQSYDVIQAAQPLQQLLTELGFSSAVIDRMDKTRALDGTQNADGKNCNVTWTYHPDNGLQMVFEADAPH